MSKIDLFSSFINMIYNIPYLKGFVETKSRDHTN